MVAAPVVHFQPESISSLSATCPLLPVIRAVRTSVKVVTTVLRRRMLHAGEEAGARLAVLHVARAQAAAVVAAMQRAAGEALHGAAWPALLGALQVLHLSIFCRTPTMTPTVPSQPHRLLGVPTRSVCDAYQLQGNFVRLATLSL